MNLSLAQRLERAEASASVALVEAHAHLEPASGATWTNIGGAYAIYDGAESPLTQTFGVGLFDAFGEREFAIAESFFEVRGAPTFHEVCSFAAAGTVRLLEAGGYVPIEYSTVLMRETRVHGPSVDSDITVRVVPIGEVSLWTDTLAEGWSSEGTELSAFIKQFGAIMAQARGVSCFLAEQDGAPIAAAALNMQTDVALLAGASTVPGARGRGAQRTLLQARLAYATGHGVDVAMIVTKTGSGSQRNAERSGFRPVYERTKWEKSSPN